MGLRGRLRAPAQASRNGVESSTIDPVLVDQANECDVVKESKDM